MFGIDRKRINMHGMVHRRADVDRYVPQKNGGTALRKIEAAYNTALHRPAYQLHNKGAEDQILETIRMHEKEKQIQPSIMKKVGE